jgi:hypothetical protein
MTSIQKFAAGILCFVIPLVLYWITASESLGFADAAEFALVVNLAGIAHAPGFPAYILSGWLWTQLAHMFEADAIRSLVLYSAICTAAATVLLYLSILKILEERNSSASKNTVIASVSAISFALGATTWFWSNCIEVYAFHLLAMSMSVMGLIYYHFHRNPWFLIFVSIGLGLGLGNHHLTMILFLPFIPFFFMDNLFKRKQVVTESRNSKKKEVKESAIESFVKVLVSKNFLLLAGSTAVITSGFYLWMFVRAGAELPFKFGNPDNFERLIYHLTGGAWIKTTKKSVEGLWQLRMPYFSALVLWQYLFFLPFLFAGIFAVVKSKMFRLLAVLCGYYLIVQVYQLRIDQTSDTDAYMLLPFFMGSFLVAFGIDIVSRKNNIILWILPIVLIAQGLLVFPKTDKRDYNISETLLRELDRSAPPNSIVLIADWTLVIQYHFNRIVNNFRPDLVVLNYDLKFTNYKIVPTLYPEFYHQIQAEYDDFIFKLGQAHPQEIYNTGGTFDTPEIFSAYSAVIKKMRSISENEKRPMLVDPKTYVFLVKQKVIPDNLIVSGCLVSNMPTQVSTDFTKLEFAWLDSPILLSDPAATDKMVDIQAMLDFHRMYHQFHKDSINLAQSQQSLNRILQLQRLMKKKMPFIYRKPGN